LSLIKARPQHVRQGYVASRPAQARRFTGEVGDVRVSHLDEFSAGEPNTTRKVMPPRSLTQAACAGLPAANRPTTEGTGGGGEGTDKRCLFSALQAADSWEH